ncbi:hypothetical protein PC121_g2850 [Phytophthora cactorum]|nr:hypothetical protein PC120_g1604 [Phytophthora cactorum]KAG3095064.1 hypothetical protein PC121_g2850 [Phytophthora cactorum]KAG4063266.1 hypothetical protein PC123_g1907 [Phytophthora cactorum]
MAAVLVDPALILSVESSESKDHNRCDGESSSSDVSQDDTMQQNTPEWPLIVDTVASEPDSDSGSWLFDTMAGEWTFVPLTAQTVQVALDAVRYQKNYARTVTTRLCVHYINTIRVRVSSGVMSYLFSVDGCQLSQVEPTGRCDIYYCRPYTYEVQVTQKAVGSDVFMVQSIYKTVDQKSLTELREDSNLDFSTVPEADIGTGIDSVIKQADTRLQSQQPKAWQDVDGGLLQRSSSFDDEEPIAWTSDANNFLDSQSQINDEQLSLRAEPVSMAASESKKDAAVGTESEEASVVAIVGIVAVAIAAIAFVIALVVSRWRARRNTSQYVVNLEYSPLRSTLNTVENTLSMTSRDSVIGADTKPDLEKETAFFGHVARV